MNRAAHILLAFLLMHAQLIDSASPRSLLSTHIRRDDDGIPPSPPWVYPNTIKPTPKCMALTLSDDCPFSTSSSIKSCSAEKCTMTFIGSCMQKGTLVDKSCFCTDKLNERSCSACSGTRTRTQYLSWLNSTCGDITGWHGLSKNWTRWDPKPNSFCRNFNDSLWNPNIYNATEAAAATFRYVNKTYSPWFNPKYSADKYDPLLDSGLYLDLNAFCKSVYPPSEDSCGSGGLHSRLLLWASTKCKPPQGFGWTENWKDDLAILNSSFVEKSTLPSLVNTPGSQRCSNHINTTMSKCISQRCKESTCAQIVDAIGLSCFCKEMDLPEKCNPVGVERSAEFLWLNSTCASVAAFPGLPKGWEDSLLKMNSTYGAPTNFTTWPKCANANNCGTNLNTIVTNCTQNLCNINPQTGLCTSILPGVNPACYCSPNCKLSWEREQYLNWMNTTCGLVSSWHGLPSNWVDLLLVQDSELLPWNWRIRISYLTTGSNNSTSSTSQGRHCPSASSKLAAFAVVNVAMLVLIPILGRRDVMKKITFGTLGHRASLMWLVTGPFTVLLHIASNAIAALIIKRTPGFGSVEIGQLILLWCTRPRLAWMIVALIPFQASEEIYFSVASSTMIAEVILQTLGGYYMGVATNYARRQKFYQRSRLAKTPKGRDAMIMYAGSIMWLSIIVIAIATCVWSLLGLSNFVASVAFAIRGLDRQARKRSKIAEYQANQLASQQSISSTRYRTTGLDKKFPNLDNEAVRMCKSIQMDMNNLSRFWKRVETYVTKDMKAMRAAQRTERAREKGKRKGNRTQGQNYPQDENSINNTTRTLVTDSMDQAYATWYNTPESQRLKIHRLNEVFSAKETWVRQNKTAILNELDATERRLQTYRVSLSEVDAEIRCLDNVIRLFATSGFQSRSHDGYWRARQCDEAQYLNALLVAGKAKGEQYYPPYPKTNWKPSRREVGILQSFKDKKLSYAKLRAQLIGPCLQAEEGNDRSQVTLKRLVENEQLYLTCLKELRAVVLPLPAACATFTRDCKMLISIWTKQKAKREAEKVEKQDGNSLLKKIAIRTIAGMIGCSIAQWIWWVGYIKVAGDTYCPPKLGKIAVIWTLFSLLGGMVGGSF
ncbi:uncharacterized protein BDR25DRAFT_310647 [Lindgomyces ingoldianus]|uniref:Uncharacterized protein n=1 Tax=Lindgomyces ingoldianus TaxID=673940 RepID=A0ACB6RA70_9PLEO|nr:uncharacterized protein BDR25DRAFT_310647 [Lindgomyces ingoldianus]KAF2475222.1 hypothetical protein BDR25DRAFT_310647 [Lindgomyces ingoldianus]